MKTPCLTLLFSQVTVKFSFTYRILTERRPGPILYAYFLRFAFSFFSEFPDLNSLRSRSAMAIRPASVLLHLTRRHRTTRQPRTLQLTTHQLRTHQLTTLQLRTPKLTTRQPTTPQLMSRPPTTLRPMMLILRIRVPLRTTPPMMHPLQAPLQAPLLRPLAPASK